MPKKKGILLTALIDMGESLGEAGFIDDTKYARWKESVYNQVIVCYGFTHDALTEIDTAFWQGEYVHADPPTVPDPNRGGGRDAVVMVLEGLRKGEDSPND